MTPVDNNYDDEEINDYLLHEFDKLNEQEMRREIDPLELRDDEGR